MRAAAPRASCNAIFYWRTDLLLLSLQSNAESGEVLCRFRAWT